MDLNFSINDNSSIMQIVTQTCHNLIDLYMNIHMNNIINENNFIDAFSTMADLKAVTFRIIPELFSVTTINCSHMFGSLPEGIDEF